MDHVSTDRLNILAREAAERMASQSAQEIKATDLLLVIGEMMRVHQRAEIEELARTHADLMEILRGNHSDVMIALQQNGVKLSLSPRWVAGIATVVAGIGTGIGALGAKFRWW